MIDGLNNFEELEVEHVVRSVIKEEMTELKEWMGSQFVQKVDCVRRDSTVEKKIYAVGIMAVIGMGRSAWEVIRMIL